MNWSCVYCGENGICTQLGNIRYNKICGINEGLVPCKNKIHINAVETVKHVQNR